MYLYIGEMAEWLKAHAWKACKAGDSFAGSDPALSAIKRVIFREFFNSFLVLSMIINKQFF